MEEVKKLYTALIGKGYTNTDLGDEKVFAEKMMDEQNRKELYDYVSSRGDFNIGSYDNYEKRLGSTVQPVQPVEDAPKVEEKPQENLKSDLFKPQSTETPSLLNMGAKPKNYFAEVGAKVMENLREERQEREFQDIMEPFSSIDIERKKALEQRKQQIESQLIQPDAVRNAAARTNMGKALENVDNELQVLNEQEKQWKEKYGTWTPSTARRFREQTMNQTWHDPYAVVPEEYKALATKQWGKEGSEDAYFSAWMNLSPQERETFIRQEHIKSLYNEDTAKQMQGIRERATAKQQEELRAENAAPSSYPTTITGTIGTGVAKGLADVRRLSTQTTKALAKAEEIKQAYKNHNKLDEGFFTGAYKGMKDGLTDIDNWTGVYMIGEMKNLYDIADKIEKGVKLSQEEEDFLDAQAYKLAVEAALAEDLGWGYMSGNMTGASVPFMLQMLASPLSGASGKTIDKGFATLGRRAIDRYGKGILKKLLTKAPVKKVAKGLVGTVGKGIGQTVLFHSDRVAAGTMGRHLGNEMVANRANEEFNAGVQAKEGESWGKAFLKEGVSASMENISEFAGSAFIDDFTKIVGKKISKEFMDAMGGAVGRRLANAASRQKANKVFQAIAKNKWGQHAVNLGKSIQNGMEWDGLLNEYLEEVLNNAVNVAIGDMSMDDFTSLEKNAETILGLAWTSGFFTTYNAASRMGGYIRGNIALKRTERAAREVFTRDMQQKWDEYTQSLSMADGYEEVEELYKNLLGEISRNQDKDMAAAQMNEATSYMVNYVKMMGMNASTEEAEEEEPKTPAQQEVETAQGEGISAQGTERELDVVEEMDESYNQLATQLNGSNVEEWLMQYGETADKQLEAIQGSELDEQTKAIAEAYITSAQRYEGLLLANQEEVDAIVEEATKEFDANVNKELDSVIRVYTTQGKEAYVIQGNPHERGEVRLRYKDGTTEPVLSKAIEKILSEGNAQAIRGSMIEGVRKTAISEIVKRMQGIVPNATQMQMPVGHNVVIDGQPGVVSGINEDGSMQIQMEGGSTVNALPQQVMDAQAYNDIMERKARARESVKVNAPVEEQTEAQKLLQEYMDESVSLEDRQAIVANNVAQAKQTALEAQAEVDAMAESKPKAKDYTNIAEFKQAQAEWEAQMHEKQQILDLAKQQEATWNEVQSGMATPVEAVEVATEQEKTESESVANITQATEVQQAEARDHNSKHDIKALAKEIGVSEKRIKRVIDFANKIGVKLNFANVTRTGGNTGAFTNAENIASKREITLSKYMLAKGMAIEWVMGHELTHQIKADGNIAQWEAYKQTIINALGQDTFDERVKAQSKVYRNAGAYRNMSANEFVDTIEEEVCADAAGDMLLNPDNMDKVLGVPVSLASRIWNGLKNMVGINTPARIKQAVDAWQQLAEGGSQVTNVSDEEGKHSITPISHEERSAMENRIVEWLTPENVEWAEGKSLQEIIDRLGNELEPIAAIPNEVALFLGTNDNHLYSGKAYFVDHAANHHPELTMDEYAKMQEVIENYDDIKDLSDESRKKIAFIKKLDKGYAVVAELSNENGKALLHKTFFYRDSKSTRVPYKSKPSIKDKLPVDGSTTISPITSNSRQTPNISALDNSASKDTQSVSTEQTDRKEISEKSAESNVDVTNEEVVKYSISPLDMPEEEKYRRGEMLRNAPAVDVQSNVITATPELSARKAAEQWWEDNIPEAMLYETEVGEVEINKNSIESSLAHRYGQKKLDAITSLAEGFENAVYLGTLPDGNRQEGVMNHYFAYPINYEGQRNYVFCRAMQDANKNRLYVHEVFVEDKITKGNTLQTAASQPHGGISLYRDILANVLSASKDTQSVSTEQTDRKEISEKSAESNVDVTNEGVKKNSITSVNEEIANDKMFSINDNNVASYIYNMDATRAWMWVLRNSPKGVRAKGYGYIDKNRLEEFQDWYDSYLDWGADEYIQALEELKNRATKKAQEYIDEVIAGVEKYRDDFRRLAEGDDTVLSTSNAAKFSLSAEEQGIIDVAKTNGTYMKAPNGKDTNLNEKQWAQVRTKAFKEWFGDWEKVLRIEKLRGSNPIVVEFNGEYELNRDSAKQWMKDNLRGEYVNADTGEKIQISKVGINEVTAHGSKDEAHLKSLSAIPSMIEGAVFVDELANTKEHDKYDSYRYYVCGLVIDGVDYTAKIVIGVKDGSRYYDHRLTEIEKGTLLDNLNGLSNSVVDMQNTSSSVGKDTKLISILQTNSSKIVDENGEPMVVYHYTPNEFTEFDTDKIGSSTDVGAFGTGFYLSPSEGFSLYGKNKMALFVNAKNPMRLNDSNAFDAKEPFFKKDYEWTKESAQAFADDVQAKGYDAVYYENRGMDEIVAFNPNQIKSATENNGEFSEENNDIRYSINTYHGSGAKFDKFDHAFMGSGEGAQAFGWGTYVTEVEGIAKAYADSSSGNIFLSGFGDFYLRKIREGLANGETFEKVKQNLLEYHKQIYEKTGGNRELYGDFISDYEKLQSLKEEDLPARNLYTVEIPDDNGSNYLEWDKAINEDIQQRIANGLKNIGFKIEPKANHLTLSRGKNRAVLNVNAKGKDLYAELEDALGSDKAASMFLSDLGYTGIKYPAESLSGGRSDNAQNYVIFNEEDARIVDHRRFSISSDPNVILASQRFDSELDNFKNKTHKGLLHLGSPNVILHAIGVDAQEMTLSPSVLHQHLKEHNLEPDDLKGLAIAVQTPILAYKHGLKYPNLVLVTELDVKGGKLSVSLEIDNQGHVVAVSNIKSVHSKEAVKEMERLMKMGANSLKDNLKWVEKEKVSEWLLRLPYEDERTKGNPELSLVANVLLSHQNPTLPEDQSSLSAENVTPTEQNEVKFSMPPRPVVTAKGNDESLMAYAERVAKIVEQQREWDRVYKEVGKPIFDIKKEIKNATEYGRILTDKTPKTIEEAAAVVLSSAKLLWNDYTEGTKVLKGVKSMMGWSDEERKKMLALYASREKGGVSLEKAAESVAEICSQYGIPYDENDAMAGVNAIMEVLGASETFGDISKYIENNRIAMVQKMVEAEEESIASERNQEYYEQYGMTYDELKDIVEQIDAEDGTATDDDKKVIAWLYGYQDRQNKRIEKLTEEAERLRSEGVNTGTYQALSNELNRAKEEAKASQEQLDEALGQLRNAKGQITRYKKAKARWKDINERWKNMFKRIQEMIHGKNIGMIDKNTLNSILRTTRAVGAGSSSKLIDQIEDIEHILIGVETRAVRAEIDKLLAVSTTAVNQKGISTGKSVDPKTQKILQRLRDSLQLMRHHPLMDEIHELRSQNWHIRNDETGEYSSWAEEQKQERIRENNAKISTFKSEAAAALNTIAISIEENIQKQIADVIEQSEKGEFVGDIDVTLAALDIQRQMAAINTAERNTTTMEAQLAARQSELREIRRALKEGNIPSDKIEEYKQKEKMLPSVIAGLNDCVNVARESHLQDMQTLRDTLLNLITEGRGNLKEKIKAELRRRNEFIRNAMYDVNGSGKAMQTVNTGEQDESGKLGWFKAMYANAVGSFDYMLQKLATRTMGKDSWLYQQFMLGPEGVMAANTTYLQGLQHAKDMLDKKSQEIFDKDYVDVMKDNAKVKETEIMILKNPASITEGDAATYIPLKVSKGQATYIYMLWKMADGRVKLEAQGFDEEIMEYIKDYIGAENTVWADWIQDEFLPNLREKYNERYREMFNTDMAAIENYVPIKIEGKSIRQEVDLTQPTGNITGLQTKNGSLIKRVANINPIDLSTNAMELILDHVTQMEEFYAYAPVRRDLQYILSSQAFRNQVNANSAGTFLRLVEAARIAVRANKPPVDINDHWQNILSKVQKGLVGKNIAYRTMTALKQALSVPAFYAYSQDPAYIVALTKNIAVGYARNVVPFLTMPIPILGQLVTKKMMQNTMSAETYDGVLGSNFAWCMQNFPDFRDRVLRNSAGDIRLEESTLTSIQEKVLEIGMAHNVFVDALTVSIGLKSIYDYEMERAKKNIDEMFVQEMADVESEAERAQLLEWKAEELRKAENLAKSKAILYCNQTQQSGNPALLAPMQVSSNFILRAVSLYKNSNLGFVRKTLTDAKNVARFFRGTTKQAMINEYARRLMAEKGLTLVEAKKKAKAYLSSETRKSLVSVAMYGYILNLIWQWGSKGLLGMMQGGGDDEEKTVMQEIAKYVFMPATGIPFVDWATEFITEGRVPVVGLTLGQVEEMYKDISSQLKESGVSMEVITIAINHMMRFGGVDLEVFANSVDGWIRMAEEVGDPDGMILALMLILNSPKSNRLAVARELYKDKSPEEFERAMEIAGRYNQPVYALGNDLTKRVETDMVKQYIGDNATEDEKRRFDEIQNLRDRIKNIETMEEAIKLYDLAPNLEIKKEIENRMQKIANPTKEKTFADKIEEKKTEMLAEADEDYKSYDKLKNSNDVLEDIQLRESITMLKPVWDDYQERKDWKERLAYESQHKEELVLYVTLGRYRTRINQFKKEMDNPSKDANKMLDKIREIRRDALEGF